MAFQNNNQDETHIEEVKYIGENMIPYINNLEQIMHFSENNILPSFLQFIVTDKACKEELAKEYVNEENIASLISQNQENNGILQTKNLELKELEEKEAMLKANIERITHKLKKLESIHEKNKHSEIKRKLTTCKNFAKISKRLTGTSFEYQGPNVSGIISGIDKIQAFDLNPNKLSRQNISKHLWEYLGTTCNANWLDIFDVE